jgi:hypothetical protein
LVSGLPRSQIRNRQVAALGVATSDPTTGLPRGVCIV